MKIPSITFIKYRAANAIKFISRKNFMYNLFAPVLFAYNNYFKNPCNIKAITKIIYMFVPG